MRGTPGAYHAFFWSGLGAITGGMFAVFVRHPVVPPTLNRFWLRLLGEAGTRTGRGQGFSCARAAMLSDRV
jgi:hypothetical protein